MSESPEAPTDPTPGHPPDIWSRIMRFGPVFIVLFCIGVLVFVGVVHPFETPSPELTTHDVLVGADHDPTGAYLVIHNAGGPDTLVSASTPAAASVELQSPSNDANGALVTVDHLDVRGFTDLRLQPGGDQLLLKGLTAPLAVGQKVPLTLQFQKSGAVVVEAEVATYPTIADRLLPPRLKLAGEQ